jgi:hypothetical protein
VGAALLAALTLHAAEPDFVRFAPLPGNPQLGADVGCVRLRGGGVPLSTEAFQLLAYSAGPNGVAENGAGDDLLLGPVPAQYSFTLLSHHARYQVDDPRQVGEIDAATGLFTAGSGLATGLGRVEARTAGGKRAEAPVFILAPDFVANPPPRIHHLSCEARGAAVRLEWLPGGPYLFQTVYRDGAEIARLPGDARTLEDGAAGPGIHEYEVVGTARDAARDRELDSDPTRCVVVSGRPPLVHLLWSPAEQRTGRTDSAAAIREALLQNGEEVHEVAEIVGVNLRDFRAVWAVFGTYPHEHYLWLSEAVQLADYLVRDRGKLYIEGADVWGFVPTNAFHRVDGVFDCPEDDLNCVGVDGGTSDLFHLRGADGGNGLDLSPFAGPLRYSGENMFIDRLLPGPRGSAAVWFNADVGYAAGIAYRASTYRTIQCSFEFGGIEGDRQEIMRRYLQFLDASTTDLRFIRGDADMSGAVDITDAIAVLGFLFLGSPLPDCPDARDSNDDGEVDITDAIRILSFLFLGGPPPRGPFPDCGTDPTPDAGACFRRLDCPG